MPPIPRPDENGTVETNDPGSVNENNKRNRISGQESNVTVPKSTPTSGTVTNRTTSSGHIASRPTSDQHVKAPPASATALYPKEISALNSSFELPMRQVLTRSSSMEVLVGDRAEDVSNGDE